MGNGHTAFAMAPIRVLLAVGSSDLLRAYEYLIASDDELDLVAHGTDVSIAIAEVLRTKPHIAVLDFSFRDGSGLQAAEHIRIECPATQVILLSDYDDDEYQQAAQQAGVGCVAKTAFASLIPTIKSLSTAVKEIGR